MQVQRRNIPVTVGGDALAWTGDFESPFFVVSIGEEPMIEFNGGCG